MSDDSQPIVLTTAPWMVAAVGVAELVFTLVALAFYLHEGWTVTFTVLLVIAVLANVGLLEVMMSRVILSGDTLEVRSLRSRKRYASSDIRAVRWEQGSGVSLQLQTGRWAKLPELGRNSQSVANTVRAWLDRRAGSGG